MSTSPKPPAPGLEWADTARSQRVLAAAPTDRVRWVTMLWALSPLFFGFSACPCFAWAARRLRSRSLAIEAAAYGAVTVLWIALASANGTASSVGSALSLGLGAFACVRALAVRRQLLSGASLQAQAIAPTAAASARTDTNWTPAFPAQTLEEQGDGWASSFACDGQDRHDLSIPMRRAAASGLVGAALIVVDLALHRYGRALGAGIGLVCVPLVAVLFARWVDGPVLYYRSWGRLHQLTLTSVISVATGGSRASRRTVLLSAPGLAKPLALSMGSRGYVMSDEARAHLRGWLGAPHVQWTPQAASLLDGADAGQASTARNRGRLLARAMLVGLPLAGVGLGFWVVTANTAAFAIPGAPGYSTFTGPRGEPLAVGRPWGEPCQPVRFTVEEHVPQWVYSQIAATVAKARADGIDVTIENRQFYWSPGALYYVGGQSVASTVRVAIFADDGSPPSLATGQPEHIELDWNARPDPDGQHEDLTLAQGVLWMQPLAGHPQEVRLATRQLIAMTQGILNTSRHAGLPREAPPTTSPRPTSRPCNE